MRAFLGSNRSAGCEIPSLLARDGVDHAIPVLQIRAGESAFFDVASDLRHAASIYRTMNRVVVLSILGMSLVCGGCSTIRTAGHVVDAVKMLRRGAAEDDTAASFTIRNGPEMVALAEGLSQFDVRADIEAVEQGVSVLRLVGAYVEVLHAIEWLIVQGATAILGNDELSQTLLYVILKSGG